MKRVILVATALAAVGGFVTPMAVQQPAEQGQSQPPQKPLEIIEVIGCLEEAPASTWIVTSATEPVVSKSPATTATALKAAEAKPLGKERYRLIGTSIFSPESHKGHKVAVKGLLIKDAKESRINITSLQTVAPTCAK